MHLTGSGRCVFKFVHFCYKFVSVFPMTPSIIGPSIPVWVVLATARLVKVDIRSRSFQECLYHEKIQHILWSVLWLYYFSFDLSLRSSFLRVSDLERTGTCASSRRSCSGPLLSCCEWSLERSRLQLGSCTEFSSSRLCCCFPITQTILAVCLSKSLFAYLVRKCHNPVFSQIVHRKRIRSICWS